MNNADKNVQVRYNVERNNVNVACGTNWTNIGGVLWVICLCQVSCSVTASRQYGYFNGHAVALLPNTTWDLANRTQVSFRTCNKSGEIIKMEDAAGNFLQIDLRNGSLLFLWRANSTSGSVSVGNYLNNNKWVQVELKYYLGSIVLSASEGERTFTKAVANSTHFSDLLDVRLQNLNLVIGRKFMGCLFSGILVDFFRSDLRSTSVDWGACPLKQQTVCNPGDEDRDDCWSSPCVQGTCVDGDHKFTCNCPPNYNGTLCEHDLSQLGCNVVNLCQNNGSCVLGEGSRHMCQCVPGYTGVNCENEIDECRNNRCRTGSCIDLINNYTCNCTGSGYYGPRCENDINECQPDPHPCGSYPCINSPGGFTCLCPQGKEGIGCTTDVNECLSNPCRDGSTCNGGDNTYTCTCQEGYTGRNCEVDIDYCVNVTCRSPNASCMDQQLGYTCQCMEGYTGLDPVCVDIDECAFNPCVSGATCQDLVNTYKCICPAGFNGTRCERNINECISQPCHNGGTCRDRINGYSCQCHPGFRGDNCDENIQECQEQTIVCRNGGTCEDGVNAFHCACAAGWTGELCDSDIDDCASHPCDYGATCNNFVNYYNCTCVPGFAGFNCSENIDDCSPNPCQNGGRCIDDLNGYACKCASGWMGVTCREEYDACSFSPCQNNATCATSRQSLHYNCTCHPGFDGKNCSNNINDCRADSCDPVQHCYDLVQNFTCGCPLGFTGNNCSVDIDECAGDPCKNGGTCHQEAGSYRCECVQSLVNLTTYTPGLWKNEFYTGWEGPTCEVNIDECKTPGAVPCLSGGICQDRNGTYKCYCEMTTEKFDTGLNCEAKSSYCSNEELRLKEPPCRNGGTCISKERHVECHCAPGFTGDRCQTNIFECASNPCAHNGTCIDGINGYNCSCIPGIIGDNCETNVDDCWPFNPCLNYGTCNDLVNNFECDCSDTGFRGSNCTENIDDCVNATCRHNATCVDGVKSYQCACLLGYTGIACETDIDECISSPCQFNGTCLQRSNQTIYGRIPGLGDFSYAHAAGYICQCIPGITGANCEVNINECESTPCQHGGTCQDHINSFTCQCQPGYQGNFCETEIMCVLYEPCDNGATCADNFTAADYDCMCPAFQKEAVNYGGKNCSVALTGCNHEVLCENDATCFPILTDEERLVHDYRCLCTAGHTGKYCGTSTTVSFEYGAKVVMQANDFELRLRFRTTLKAAVLMFYKPGDQEYLSVEIYDQKLYAVYGSAQGHVIKRPVKTRSRVNDAKMHSVTVIIKQNITVIVDDRSLCLSKESCTESFSFPRALGTNRQWMYLGNTESTLLASSLSKTAFTGCMEDITYNGQLQMPSTHAEVFVNVTEGCDRTKQCHPETCSWRGNCDDLWNTFKCNCDRPYLGTVCMTEFTPATFSKANTQSWASFSLSQDQKNRLGPNIDLSLFVWTRQSHGLILYFGSPRNFLTLEMRDGKLSSRVSYCDTSSWIVSETRFDDGHRQFVKVTVSATNIAFNVNPDTMDKTQFSHALNLTSTGCPFDVDAVYFGGRHPDSVNVLRRRRRRRDAVDVANFSGTPYFQGIVQDVEVNSIKFQFFPVSEYVGAETVTMNTSTNLTSGKVSTENACDRFPCKQNGTCTDLFYNDYSCECPHGYRGKDCEEQDLCVYASCPVTSRCQSFHNGYDCISTGTFNGIDSLAKYNAILNNSRVVSQISLKLRTGMLYGVIMHIQNGVYFMKLRLARGKIQLNYKLNNGMSKVLDVQAKINNGTQKKVTIMVRDNKIKVAVYDNGTLIGEENATVDSPLTNLAAMIENGGSINVGGIGVPRNNRLWEQPFKGCLEEIRIAGFLLPFFYDSNFENNSLRTEKFEALSLIDLTETCENTIPTSSAVAAMARNSGTCLVGWDGMVYCICKPGYTGKLCETDIDDCAGSSCFHGGVCVDHVAGSSCKCRNGFWGNRCENDKTFCNSTTCTNNGSCQEESSGFTCTCPEQFTGVTCAIQVNQTCQENPCQNGGACVDVNRTVSSETLSSFNCTCPGGYEGPVCERTHDFCANLPCGSHGNCTSNVNNASYTCICDAGLTGTTCQTDINDCPQINTCQNGGKCIDLINDYRCNCTSGWQGENCSEDVNECQSNPCGRGSCLNTSGSYMCNCSDTGYQGTDCQTQVNECELPNPPCQNSANCSDTEGSYNCSCTLGYTGYNCDTPNCSMGQCQNGGTCLKNATQWSCDCAQYYEGNQCEIAGPCLTQTCLRSNTKRCEQNVVLNNFTCVCNSGWEGANCTDNIDECTLNSHSCKNGATCNDTLGSYDCLCIAGYKGKHCQTNINDCNSTICNSGVCLDGINSYSCNCSNTGFKGNNCNEDINECETNPCQSNRKCVNTHGSFKCPCSDGFVGINCEQDPCTNTICEHNGFCNYSQTEAGALDAMCFCTNEYEGVRCEKLAGAIEANDLNIWYIIGPVIAIVIMVSVIGIVVFVMMARTKRATRGTYSPSRQETSGARVELGNVLKKPPEERLI